MSRLLHYPRGGKFTGGVRSTEQTTPSGFYEKPHGLWVSVEGACDWASWCVGNDFDTEFLSDKWEIVLAENANILRIASIGEIDAFTEKYGIYDTRCHEVLRSGGLATSHFGRQPAIDWPRVAKEYQGIIIAPYIWERRMETHTGWYYGWDCASGCIWDAEAIASARRVVYELAAESQSAEVLQED